MEHRIRIKTSITKGQKFHNSGGSPRSLTPPESHTSEAEIHDNSLLENADKDFPIATKTLQQRLNKLDFHDISVEDD